MSERMSVRITWWGHATATIELGGARVLTDPLLVQRLAHLRRLSAVPPQEATIADVVLISHLHPDHLHVGSLRRLRGVRDAVVPAGAGGLVRGSWRTHELQVAGVADLGAVRVTAVSAHHDGRRLPYSRVQGPALGYVLEHEGTRVWFAGDTGPFAAMADIGPVDVALLPVGGWGPTLGPEHLDPVQAAAAARLVGARHAVPIHYGTLWPVGLRRFDRGGFVRRFREPGVRFAAELAGSGTEVHVLAAGATVVIDG